MSTYERVHGAAPASIGTMLRRQLFAAGHELCRATPAYRRQGLASTGTTMSNSGTHTLCVAGACRQPLFSMIKLGVQSTVAKSTNECLRMRSTHSFSGSMLTACRISDNWVEQHASSQLCGSHTRVAFARVLLRLPVRIQTYQSSGMLCSELDLSFCRALIFQ